MMRLLSSPRGAAVRWCLQHIGSLSGQSHLHHSGVIWSAAMDKRDQFRRHVAIALVAAAIILLQIGLTRVLSVLLWYHWAFFSISLSMLGVGAPGVWFAVRKPGPKTLTISLLSAGLLVPLGMFLVMGHSVVFGDMAVVYCMLALLPAVLSLGAAVCLLLLDAEGDAIGPRYAYDLLGACMGALVVVPLMWVLPTPELCASLGLLPLLALALLEPRFRWPSLIGALLIPAVAFGEVSTRCSTTNGTAKRAPITPYGKSGLPRPDWPFSTTSLCRG